jgi:transposase
MDALPVETIEKIEFEIVRRVREIYGLESDTLFFDTSNFFTFIATGNDRCRIAKRGRNKQKRHDLRQVGLAMVVTKEDFIPLFHISYAGNLTDTVVFRKVIAKIKKRMVDLRLDINKHTLVFDRGNNSKKNLGEVARLKLHYVGALTPYHHKTLLEEATGQFEPVRVGDNVLQVYRTKKNIWDAERTVLVFVSDKLKAGQLAGIYQALQKKEKQLLELQTSLDNPRGKKRGRDKLEERIASLVKGQFLNGLIQWTLTDTSPGHFHLDFSLDEKKLVDVEQQLGFRILITDRHHWTTQQIIQAYHGQSTIEEAFKNLKNPHHLALKPQFHWTDQKIHVHYFMCVLGYLLTTLIWRKAKSVANFTGSLTSLLDNLNNIRLATLLEKSPGPGRPKATYQLEEMSNTENALCDALQLKDLHLTRPKIKEVGVYK